MNHRNTNTPSEGMSPEDRQKLSGLLGFAQGVLNARAKVQMSMSSGLGVFREDDITGLPGLHFDCDDGSWLRMERQRETKPPEPVEHVKKFLVSQPNDPAKSPAIKDAIAIEVSIDEASELADAGLLRPENTHEILQDGVVVANHVKVILIAEDCPDMRRDFNTYVGGPWSDWARLEKPVRKAISLYNDLFKIHSSIHTAEATPPELVWGIGIGRWQHAGQTIDMPLIEQQVDIEVEDGGSIAIRPRSIPATLSLKPYLELDIDGSPRLQHGLQDRLAQILMGEAEFSPFTTEWEPLLDTAISKLASTGDHITRQRIDAGEILPKAGKDLRIASTWAIFGRPRSHEARAQDLEALRRQVDNDAVQVPQSIRGYSTTPPDAINMDVSGWGIDSTILDGGGANTWTEPSGSNSREPSPTPFPGASGNVESPHKVHFFPLPFNEEQGKISDMIDNPRFHVATVSGPPGTGKSHSIANIISHQMATGKRVLVTARTPEAIAAVREKLPKSLQPLVIASVGTDRESAQQLQDAVSELSNEVVGLDIDASLALKARLEQRIVDCDKQAEAADRKLAEIARANLEPLEWNGEKTTPMDLVDILEADEPNYGWFTDRPASMPPAQICDTVERLTQTLPQLAGDIFYAGADLPSPADLPSTPGLISAHESECAWSSREQIDYSSAPTMARDSAGAEDQARAVLKELEQCQIACNELSVASRAIAVITLADVEPIDRVAIENTLSFISSHTNLDAISQVRYTLGPCDYEEFTAATARGAAGQKPVGFSLFGGNLKIAVASVTVDGTQPSDADGWKAAHHACRMQQDRDKIKDALQPLILEGLMASCPQQPWELATYLKERQAEIQAALQVANRIAPIITSLGNLFPYGLDANATLKQLDFEPAIFALKGNIPDSYQSPTALTSLLGIAGDSNLPIFSAIRDLAGAIGKPDTNPSQIISLRGEITTELTRLSSVAPHLKALGSDLKMISDCGAPAWADAMKQNPLDVEAFIPSTWKDAWAWAVISGRVHNIIELGNGDQYRDAKAEAMRQRRRLFEDLIRIRTLLGLAKRMTPSIRQAMEAFTQAISKIGTGKGKKAPRFIRAAQDAAKQASSAAPVWIMPEYKIPEQLPPEFGDFDLVIIDEASQSDITALAALARGKKILVVGDEEQVSPTAVGIPVQKINALRAEYLDGLPNAALIDENSSIFEVTKRMHPESHVMLREHFRCVAPIIQFSTRFYNNSLVPLRVPKASERFDPPLADVYIPGATRQGKTNPFEARWIVDEIARIIEDPAHNGRDIGVISLIGGEQAEKIGRMLVEDERIGPEVIEERRIIYGDARTMQGQERSIVFLSMVVTPGRVTSQSSKPDQQRFNVAMSRAKDRLYLVRSVNLNDLKPTDIKADILAHFADPMPDGRGVTGVESTDLMDKCDSGFEREVLKRLLEANYRVRPQVKAGGFSIDLVVEGSDDRRLAIELDGDQYHGPEVWERDMARQAALERAGWTFWRVFGSQWNSQKDFWWKNLVETLERMQIEPIGASAIDERFTETILVDAFEDLGTRDAGEATLNLESEPNDEGHEGEAEIDLTTTPAEPGEESDISEAAASAGTETPAAAEPTQSPRQQPLPLALGDDDLFSLTPAKEEALENEKQASDDATVEKLTEALEDDEQVKIVRIGSTVRLEKIGNGGKMEITIVEEGHDPETGMIGSHTPLGQVLIDANVGEVVEYHAGAYLREVKIIAVS